MERRSVILALLTGVLAGLFSGLFGIGGGTIMVPALIYLVGMDRKLAHGTSLAAIVPLALSSGLSYALAREMDLRVAAVLAIGSIIGVYMGTKLLHSVDQRVVGGMFVVLLVVSAVRLVAGGDMQGDPRSLTLLVLVLLVVAGVLVGLLAGLLGIGGGAVLVPLMIIGLGMTPAAAKGTSLAVIVVSSLIGTLNNRRHLNVDMRSAGLVGSVGVVAAFVGGRLSLSLPDRYANVMFGAFLLFVAMRMAWDLIRTRRDGRLDASADAS